MKFKEKQKKIAEKLIKDGSPIFRADLGGAKFRGIPREFVLKDGTKNLFEPIKESVLQYFRDNAISWWGGQKPTGHVLSSQIACINYLYSIRKDKNSVLSIVKNLSSDFNDILMIESDKSNKGYIQFESISDHDHLHEGTPTRGNNCTSIDALICAIHKDGSIWLILIEWKYTEHYSNQNKAIEGINNSKGKERKSRYTDLINNSSQLKNTSDHYCYYFEPFYQLMRQTLWAEQMIRNKEFETIKADNYLHIHVIPSENERLLLKKYKCSGENMETTWTEHLKDKSKYQIITPENLLSGIPESEYSELLDYLRSRYWKKEIAD